MRLDRKQLETLLEQALVPVEPSARFVRRLRAKLVTYQGEGLMSGWMVVVVIGTTILLAVASVGLFIRVVIALVSFIGMISRRRRAASEAQSVST